MPSKEPDCAEEEEGDAVASATDDDKAAGALIKQISEMFSCRSNSYKLHFEKETKIMSKGIVQIISLSCTRRELELEQLRLYFIANGYDVSEEDFKTDKIADYIIVSTCGFTKAAEDFGIKTIERLEKEKKNDCQILVGGCVPKIHREAVANYFLFDPRSYDALDEYFNMDQKYSDFPRPNTVQDIRVNNYREHGIMASNQKKLDDEGKKTLKENIDTVEKISEIVYNHNVGIYRIQCMLGCACKCTYCAIRFAIGPIESRPIDSILYDVQRAIDQGKRSIILEGDSLGGYGLDIHTNLGVLLDGIIELIHDKDISIGLPDISPRYFKYCKSQLIRLAKLGKLFNFYIPVQSGSQNIINRMNRGYEITQVLDDIIDIKQQCPNVCLGTSIIVGFPGETEQDFLDTIHFCKSAKFDYIHCHSYSDREGTESSTFDGKIPAPVILERSRRLKKMLIDITPMITIAEDTSGNRTCQG